MASITKEKGRDSWKLAWMESKTNRKSIRLGKMTKVSAKQFLVKFDELLGVRRTGGSVSQALSEWINCIDENLRKKFEDAGLVEPTSRIALKAFCDDYKASRTGLADATITRDRQVCDLLVDYFGGDVDIAKITARQAEAWTRWLASDGNKRDRDRKTLGGNTVRRRTGTASQIFKTAIRWKIIHENPFDGLAKTVRENKDRQVFVTWQDVCKVIDVASTLEWKALLAFARLTGARVPSELYRLTWDDIDFRKGEINIRSPKTKHHGASHASRSCPLFPELRPYLKSLFDSVQPGILTPMSSQVFPMVTGPVKNLGTQLMRIIKEAGLEPWPKLFNNMRSSRETELIKLFEVADVCKWFGHSPAVAARFYAQARTEEALRATIIPTVEVEGPRSSERVGVPAGARMEEMGANAGALNNSQEDSSNAQRERIPKEKGGVLIGDDGASGAPEGMYQWTILVSKCIDFVNDVFLLSHELPSAILRAVLSTPYAPLHGGFSASSSEGCFQSASN